MKKAGFLVLLLFLFIVFQAGAANALTVRLSPTTVTLGAVSSTFTVDVMIDNVTDLGGFQFDIEYNSAIVTATSASLGAFIGSTGRTTFPVGPTITPGKISFGGASLGVPAGASGNGTLATVTFTVVSQAAGALDLKNVIVTNTAAGQLTVDTIGDATLTAPAPGTLQFSLANYSVNENGGTATITATRTGGSDGAVGVHYATSNGTATAGSDYTAKSGDLAWANGDSANKTFTVSITNDTTDESDETVNLTLSAPTGAATLGAQSTAVLTIVDDDNAGVLQFSLANYSVNENGGTATITATRTGGSSGAVGVHYATSNGTATAGSDYTAKSGDLAWANGDSANKTFTVSITNDTTDESNETVNLTLTTPTGGATLGAQSTAVLTIVDDDNAGVLQFSLANYSVNENGGTATIAVTRTGGSSGAVGVHYATSNGTATAGSDYTAKSGDLAWANGDSANKTFTVSITNDTTDESNETVNLTLTAPTGAAILGAQSTAVLTIVDDDNAGVLQFSLANYSVNENGGTATIAVTRTGGSSGAVGVHYATSNGTATAGSDYTANSGDLAWANGDSANKTFTVAITNDTSDESDETVNLTLSAPTNAATLGAQSTAVLTIVDDDGPGTLQFSAATYNANESDPSATITVTRTGGVSGGISVHYATSNGTATAGDDYTAMSGDLTWIDGDAASKTFTIPIIEDVLDENNETVNLTLSGPTGGAVLGARSTAVLTIRDNDGVTSIPTLSEWGMILLSIMLGLSSIYYLRRRDGEIR